jgi:intracellular septation protein
MSETTPALSRTPKWVRYTIDFGGIAAWLGTLAITHSAITASWVIVGASILALAVGLVVERRVAPMPLVTAVLGIIFGGLTILFHDERFIKVKPTILYVLFGAFLLTGMLRGKNPLKVLMGDAFHLPDPVVRILTLRYALLFFALAVANEVVSHTVSTVTWGYYKAIGTPILIFLFAMSQAPLMMKHMPDDEAEAAPGDAKPPTDAP